ncbi:phospholipid carrier-dependent glycosyltransferase [Agaribacterium haliotis]|uniref:phospholipid carrier-dependent glycosyltransferase n=1 Tax=Agaribacterium haliotis TaxID=2013869 RepID=UPI000BB58106|nr:phospholipid carrier-dependent glycosyltransferase [Agaribacterium haliotis]
MSRKNKRQNKNNNKQTAASSAAAPASAAASATTAVSATTTTAVGTDASASLAAEGASWDARWDELLAGRRYWIVLAVITLAAAVLRFWGLGRFDQLVFDEVYFAQYGFNYLADVTFFDAHPPLSKYIIGGGIWLYNLMPFTETVDFAQVQLTEMSPVARRWINAVTGTALIPVAARALYALWPNRLASLVFALILTLEGLLIVESRYGLNNIYIAIFGLSALYFLGKAGSAKTNKLYFLLACSAMLGLTYSIKWNGLGFSAVVWGACILSYVLVLRCKYLGVPLGGLAASWFKAIAAVNPLLLIPIILLPGALIYSLLWIPHVSMIPDYGFIEVQRQIFGYHSGGVEADAHPYCSAWYGWPVMARPMSYLFETEEIAGQKIFTDVHLMANPAIIWLGAASVVLMLPLWDYNLQRALRHGEIKGQLFFQSIVIGGFVANFLPWAFVTRCLFMYHYIPAALFSFMALAWVLTQLLSGRPLLTLYRGWLSRGLGLMLLLFIVVAFIYWLPIFLGLPLSSDGFYERMWFRSWI